MSADPNCIFCKIAAGQIPCYKVFEDDAVLAFLDIGPLVWGHTLVIPKNHHATIMETPPEALALLSSRLPAIARAVLAATGTRACNVLLNNGSAAQQSIAHLHYHILPRHAAGESGVPQTPSKFHIPWDAGTLDKGMAVQLVAKIQEQLAFQR